MDRGRTRARRLASLVAALGLHGLLLLAIVQMTPVARRMFVTPAVPVVLARPVPRPLPPPPPPPPRREREKTAPAPKAAEPKAEPSPAPAPAATAPARPHLVAAPEARPTPPKVQTAAAAPGLSDAEIAGAITAGSGDGGGGGGSGGAGQGCDMIRRLQRALRADHRVQAAMARAQGAGGRPLLVWRGDWIQSSGEDGKGLAGLRQAIAMEVAFAPEPCRAEPVRGVVLLSLSDAPGAPRVALGSGVWRWSDLLFAQGVRRR